MLKAVKAVAVAAKPRPPLRQASRVVKTSGALRAHQQPPLWQLMLESAEPEEHVRKEADEHFVLGQLIESIEPERKWAQRDSVLARIELAARLDRGDEATARIVADWTEDLALVLGTETGSALVPLIARLYAAKDMRTMYVQQRSSWAAQRQAASDGKHHLMGAIDALEAHVETSTPTSASTIGGVTGLAQRLELRYTAQIKALDAEEYRAVAFLKEVDGSSVEAACAAQEAALEQSVREVLDQLRGESLEMMMRDRAERTVLSRLRDVAK